jgi:exonuclease SbcD
MKVGSEFCRYCGTPLACSVSEAQQQKGVVMVEMEEKGSTKMTALPLTPLHQVRVIKGTLEEVLREACGDYVTVILTDKVDLDVIDMQERIRLAFPNLLEIRRENQRKADYSRNIQEEELLDPYELCCSFLKEIDDEEKLILQDVLHTVQGVK